MAISKFSLNVLERGQLKDMRKELTFLQMLQNIPLNMA